MMRRNGNTLIPLKVSYSSFTALLRCMEAHNTSRYTTRHYEYRHSEGKCHTTINSGDHLIKRRTKRIQVSPWHGHHMPHS